MKQVTIENVQARIAQLETSEQIGGRLPIRHEFEMACLRMLADLMGGVDDDVRNVVGLLENNEWAEHCTKTELGQRLESEITRLYNWRSAPPVPVVRDEMLLQSLETRIRSLEIGERKGALSTQQETSLKAYRLAVQCLRSSAASDENATDNTAQQFEALATSAGSGKP